MTELHFITDKEGKIKQNLTSKEYNLIAYPLLKRYNSLEQHDHANIHINIGNISEEMIYGMRDLLEKRKYIKSIDGMHYRITKEGLNHLGELERKIR